MELIISSYSFPHQKHSQLKMSKIVIVLFALVAVAVAGLLPNEPVPIVNQEQDVSPDGSFHTKYETGNGIAYEEHGQGAVNSQGSVSYPSVDGKPIHLSWVADENGYRAEGAHLPVAPAIPAAIARALEFIAAHPYVEPKQH